MTAIRLQASVFNIFLIVVNVPSNMISRFDSTLQFFLKRSKSVFGRWNENDEIPVAIL